MCVWSKQSGLKRNQYIRIETGKDLCGTGKQHKSRPVPRGNPGRETERICSEGAGTGKDLCGTGIRGDKMNQLEVKDLCKTYVVNKRPNNVLRNVNLTVEEGEMVAVMGPSGSGKSTLLYTVSGMDGITAGKVVFSGREIGSLSTGEMSEIRLKEMGFIFQQMYMLKNLTIYDNIILPAYQIKSGRGKEGRREVNGRAMELMRKLGIAEIGENDITEVSGGQLQRACICRSLINKPKMIFADEPTGALNQQSAKEVMRELNRVNREGTTIMLVTHDGKVAAKCDRVLYIEDGNIKGEIRLGKLEGEEVKERERRLTGWLWEMGF